MPSEQPRTENETMLAAYVVRAGLDEACGLIALGLFRITQRVLRLALRLVWLRIISRSGFRVDEAHGRALSLQGANAGRSVEPVVE